MLEFKVLSAEVSKLEKMFFAPLFKVSLLAESCSRPLTSSVAPEFNLSAPVWSLAIPETAESRPFDKESAPAMS